MTTPRDPAAYAAAETAARAAMERLARAEQSVREAREKRDDAIRSMALAGYNAPEIGRTLKLPTSTVRQAIKSAIVRAAS